MNRAYTLQAASGSREPETDPPGSGTPAALACLSPASFRFPLRPDAGSGWVEHAPFAFWLVEALRPKLLVELGTRTGCSYAAFCQAVQELHLETRCYAVEGQQGDGTAGLCREDAFAEFAAFHDARYSSFSHLVRASFDDARTHFEDGSIDLLHMDARHAYEAAAYDFAAWRPKLAARAVVLLHGTNVREREFGVHRLWCELRAEHPHFEFLHGRGLGVLGFGEAPTETMRRLFALTEDGAATFAMRDIYCRLGKAIADHYAVEHAAQPSEREALRSQLSARARQIEMLQSDLDAQAHVLETARADREACASELRAQRAAAARQDGKIGYLHAVLAQRACDLQEERERADGLARELAARDDQLEALRARLDAREAEFAALRDASLSARLHRRLRALRRRLAKRLRAVKSFLVLRRGRARGERAGR